MQVINTFDVIVVGGGHAGTEAALAAARIGARTLLLTHNIETLGQLSCNPSIGGIGKSQLVREIDALGGVMALAADRSGTHFRILNASKGPAVRATRAQVDRQLYKQAIRDFLENQTNLSLFQGSVEDLLLESDRVIGVVTQLGSVFRGKRIVLTAGTFLNGRIYVGRSHHAGGRSGEVAALNLAERLGQLNARLGRLRTGTPARLDGRTIDFSQLQEQPTESVLPVLSTRGRLEDHPKQISCFVTRTNEKSHRLIRDHLHESLIVTERTQTLGPRYCPSIETKVRRFTDKPSHQVFLEFEGLSTYEVYPNGLASSLPFEIQIQLMRTIQGLENVHLMRAGYMVEYDFLDPRDLMPSLESKLIKGLFCAGQINGTTGYEEAAAQGIIAGLNAALDVQNKPAWTPRRDEAYIGVLIDDLVTQGTIEPYRMFTSRAEYRLLLREDNADLRLTEHAHRLGLIEAAQWTLFKQKRKLLAAEQQRLSKLVIRPDTDIAALLNTSLSDPIRRETSALQLLVRSEVKYDQLMRIEKLGPFVSDRDIQLQIEVQARYGGYIEKQAQEIKKRLRHEMMPLDPRMDYQAITVLSNEVKEKLSKHKPTTIGQASRISGITPAAISILLIYLKKQKG